MTVFFAGAFLAGALVAVLVATAAFFAGAFLVATFATALAAALVVVLVAVALAALALLADFLSVVLAVLVAFFALPPPKAISHPDAYCELEPTRVIVMSFPFEYGLKELPVAERCTVQPKKQMRFR